MALSAGKLEKWARQGAVLLSQNTCQSIRTALASGNWQTDISYSVYLQGSHKNSTNIREDSDVDVVVELRSTYRPDLSLLGEPERALFEKERVSANYFLEDFRSAVIKTLKGYYGKSNVVNGNKAIKILGDNDRLPAYVLPCMKYRTYRSYQTDPKDDYFEGVYFETRDEKRAVISHPEEHYEYGAYKSTRNKWYKPIIRMFKNARTFLVDHGKLDKGIAPSYFVECLLYNVSDQAYKHGGGHINAFQNTLDWLLDNTDKMHEFVCQNERQNLFDNSPDLWDIHSAQTLIRALVDLWNDGSRSDTYFITQSPHPLHIIGNFRCFVV